jgi:hypothetical protein
MIRPVDVDYNPNTVCFEMASPAHAALRIAQAARFLPELESLFGRAPWPSPREVRNPEQVEVCVATPVLRQYCLRRMDRVQTCALAVRVLMQASSRSFRQA